MIKQPLIVSLSLDQVYPRLIVSLPLDHVYSPCVVSLPLDAFLQSSINSIIHLQRWLLKLHYACLPNGWSISQSSSATTEKLLVFYQVSSASAAGNDPVVSYVVVLEANYSLN